MAEIKTINYIPLADTTARKNITTINENITTINENIRQLSDSKANKTYVDGQIAKAQLEGAGVDTSQFVTQDDLKDINAGLNETSSKLLIKVLRNGLYANDMSEDIGTLETQLGANIVSYAITNNLTNATNSNTETSIKEGFSYSASIVASNGYILSNVTVTMGGTDITSEVYSGGVINIPSVSGDIVINAIAIVSETTMYSITNTFTNVSTDNPSTSVEENGGYTANLTASDGYLLESVTITMGGVDITSSAYANGVVTISSVTGNVVITAIASEPQSKEVVFLEYLGTDGEAYINTEYVPSSINEKILLGVKYYDPTEYPIIDTSANANSFFGTNNVFGSTMWNIGAGYSILTNNSESENLFAYRINANFAGIIVNLKTGQNQYDASKPNLRFTENPMYLYLTNGLQALYLDEEMTIQPTGGTFADIRLTNTTTKLDENHPLTECYLGALNNVYSGNVKPTPIIIYCFKVWDSDDNLIIDMKPARQGATIGMYDNVRQKFFSNASSSGSFTYGEVTE